MRIISTKYPKLYDLNLAEAIKKHFPQPTGWPDFLWQETGQDSEGLWTQTNIKGFLASPEACIKSSATVASLDGVYYGFLSGWSYLKQTPLIEKEVTQFHAIKKEFVWLNTKAIYDEKFAAGIEACVPVLLGYELKKEKGESNKKAWVSLEIPAYEVLASEKPEHLAHPHNETWVLGWYNGFLAAWVAITKEWPESATTQVHLW